MLSVRLALLNKPSPAQTKHTQTFTNVHVQGNTSNIDRFLHLPWSAQTWSVRRCIKRFQCVMTADITARQKVSQCILPHCKEDVEKYTASHERSCNATMLHPAAGNHDTPHRDPHREADEQGWLNATVYIKVARSCLLIVDTSCLV